MNRKRITWPKLKFNRKSSMTCSGTTEGILLQSPKAPVINVPKDLHRTRYRSSDGSFQFVVVEPLPRR
jgi:hypothetical protein